MHHALLSRGRWWALALVAGLAGCGGGGGEADGAMAAGATVMEQAAAATASPAARRVVPDPLLRPSNAAATRMVQLKCNQTFANRARRQAAIYGDVLRQRRLADICANLPVPG